MTNKLFIVKYILFDIDFCEKINEKKSDKIDAFLKNLNTSLNRRESFDDVNDFEIIFAQNICFFDVAKNVANKVNSIKINKINSIKINKVMKKVDNKINDEIKSCLENKTILLNTNETSSLENEINICFASFIANFF